MVIKWFSVFDVPSESSRIMVKLLVDSFYIICAIFCEIKSTIFIVFAFVYFLYFLVLFICHVHSISNRILLHIFF